MKKDYNFEYKNDIKITGCTNNIYSGLYTEDIEGATRIRNFKPKIHSGLSVLYKSV